MTRSRLKREEEVRRKRARRYAGHASLSTVFTAQDFLLPGASGPQAASSPRTSAARRADPMLAGGVAPSAMRAAMESGADASLHRSSSMARDVLARDAGDKVAVKDPTSGLDVTYDLKGGAPDVDLKQVKQSLGPGRPLDGDTKAYMEWRFGVSLDKVRIHTGPKADAISKALYAHAFALGEHVAFQANTFRPGTADGDRLLAHELMHVVQAGLAPDADTSAVAKGDAKTARKSATVSEPTDSFEVEADRVADQVVAVGRGEFSKAQRGGGVDTAFAPVVGKIAPKKVSRKASREEAPAPDAEQAEAKEIKFTLQAGQAIEITIPKAKAKGPKFSTQVQGLEGFNDAPWLNLQLADGKVTGGQLKGWPAAAELKGTALFEVDGAGAVVGNPEVAWHCKQLGHGPMTLELRNGHLWGEAKLTKAELTAGADLDVVSFDGVVQVGLGGHVTANGTGVGKLGGGNLEGPLTLQYKDGATTGSLDAEIKSESFRKAYANGQSGMTLPRFRVAFEGGKWAGDETVQMPASGKGVSGESTVDLKYGGGQFSGGGDGTFAIADFVTGTVTNTVKADGTVDGKFELSTKTFSIGALTCENIRLKGGLKEGELDVVMSGALSVANDQARGTFQSNLTQSNGLVWNGDVTFKLPKMKDTKVTVSYVYGTGFSGSGRIEPKSTAKDLSGGVDIKFSNSMFSADGKLTIEAPVVRQAEVGVVYKDGKLSGSAAVQPGAFDLGRGLKVTASRVQATFGKDGAALKGTAGVAVGTAASGNLTLDYKANKLDASIVSKLTMPGIAPVDIDLAWKAKAFIGKASTVVDIPRLKPTTFLVGYDRKGFSGTARTELDVPFFKGGTAEVNLLPGGSIGGAITVNPKDVKIPGVDLTDLAVTGRIANGRLSLQGQGTARGIPGVEGATVGLKVFNDGKFSGFVEGQFKVPGLKETKARIDLKEDGTLAGKASVAADFAGATGAITVEYKAGRWGGGGKVGYSKGKFNGSLDAKLSTAGAVSGKGKVNYKVSSNFTVGADIELREDQTMFVGGRITAPSEVPLFDTKWQRDIFKYRGRFGIPGLSVQVPVVGVVGLEAQLSGGLQAFASARISLKDIKAEGTFDTKTDNVSLDVRGTLAGTGEAGVTAKARLAVGVGLGPAFIGGYVQVDGTAKAVTSVAAGLHAKYDSGSGQLAAGLKFDASAGLVFELGVSGGITGSVDLWLKEWTHDWPIASKKLTYSPGKTFNYSPDFNYTFGKQPTRDQIAPKQMPRLDANQVWKSAASKVKL